MRNLRNVIVILLLAILVIGCSPKAETSDSKESSDTSKTSEESTSEDPLQSLMSKNAEVKEKWRNLPQEFQKRVTVPQMNTIPFVVDAVDVFTLATGVLPPGVKTNFDIILKSKNSFPRIHITAFDVDGQKPLFGANAEKVKLESGVQGYYSTEESETELSWVTVDEKIQYTVRYKPEKSGKAITEEKISKIANSMIKQIKQ
ncbi:hypothetical protein LG329_02345 [Virgibacillus necropolis]|uniref:hypothetical protein n=1 Tax=Virgibacillus necropolis TaxID=163877 RepID=UPI00384B3C45